MDPEQQVAWTHALIKGCQGDVQAELLTWSPIMLYTIQAGLLAWKTGITLKAPPLDPNKLEVYRVIPGDRINLLDYETCYLDLSEVMEALATARYEVSLLSTLDYKEIDQDELRRRWQTRLRAYRVGVASDELGASEYRALDASDPSHHGTGVRDNDRNLDE